MSFDEFKYFIAIPGGAIAYVDAILKLFCYSKIVHTIPRELLVLVRIIICRRVTSRLKKLLRLSIISIFAPFNIQLIQHCNF